MLFKKALQNCTQYSPKFHKYVSQSYTQTSFAHMKMKKLNKTDLKVASNKSIVLVKKEFISYSTMFTILLKAQYRPAINRRVR